MEGNFLAMRTHMLEFEERTNLEMSSLHSERVSKRDTMNVSLPLEDSLWEDFV